MLEKFLLHSNVLEMCGHGTDLDTVGETGDDCNSFVSASVTQWLFILDLSIFDTLYPYLSATNKTQ